MTRIHDFAEGDTLAELSPAFINALYAAAFVRRANGADADAWTLHRKGGVRRLAVLVNFAKPVSGGAMKVIDASIDWSDRLIRVVPLRFANVAVLPGTPNDDTFAYESGNPWQSFYSGHTVLADAISPGDGHLELAEMSIGVVDATHALVAHRFSGASTDVVTQMLLIEATEQLGRRSTPLLVPEGPVSATDDTPIEAIDLNAVQDGAMLVQGQPRRPTDDDDGLSVDTFPLGPIVHGSPPLPQVWNVARRDGLAGRPNMQRMQPVAGGVRRVISEEVPAESYVVVDTTMDWRDRFIAFIGNYSETYDIRPGETDDYRINIPGDSPYCHSAAYTGAGEDKDEPYTTAGYYATLLSGINGSFFADEDNGNLILRNELGGAITVVGIIEASFPLGPRTVR